MWDYTFDIMQKKNKRISILKRIKIISLLISIIIFVFTSASNCKDEFVTKMPSIL